MARHLSWMRARPRSVRLVTLMKIRGAAFRPEPGAWERSVALALEALATRLHPMAATAR